MLWKFYPDVVARIFFNHCDKYTLPILFYSLENESLNRRNDAVCNEFTCPSNKKSKTQEIVFSAAIDIYKKIVKSSSISVDPSFINYFYNNYDFGVDYRNQHLTIERGEG